MVRGIGACLLAGVACLMVAGCAASGTGDESTGIPTNSGVKTASDTDGGGGGNSPATAQTPASDPGSSSPIDEAGGGSSDDGGGAPADDAGGGGTTPTLPTLPPISLPEAGTSSTSGDGGASACSTKICVDPVFDCPLQGCFNGCVNFSCK
jgi:hypothetical protein